MSRSAFENWWAQEGSHLATEKGIRSACEVAWNNGAFTLDVEITRLRDERDALRVSADALILWLEAEDKCLGTFHERVELCNFAQWSAKKAVGLPCESEYEGIPTLILTRREPIK